MRLDINLASQPYEDARQFWLRWGTAVIAVGGFTLILLVMVTTGWLDARRDHQAMAEKRALITDRDRRRSEAEVFLNRSENRTTKDESQFLNELIARKALSWTRVLEDLEKVMPPRLHLVSISPHVDEDNQLKLTMTVAGDSRDRAIELMRRMEDSRRFLQTNILREGLVQSQTGDNVLVEMSAVYLPQALAEEPGVHPASTKASASNSKPEIAANGSKD